MKVDIRFRQAAVFYRNIPGVVLANIACAAILGFLLWGRVGREVAMIWGGSFGILTVAFVSLYAFYKKAYPGAGAIVLWIGTANVVMGLQGALWGAAVWLVLPQHPLFLALLLFVLAAGATVFFFSLFSAYLVFVIAMIVPLMGRFLLLGGELRTASAALAAVFLAALIVSARRQGVAFDDNMNLLSENQAIRETHREIAEIEARLVQKSALMDALSAIQDLFLRERVPEAIFDETLAIILSLTNSRYGFIGEIVYDDNEQVHLKTFSVSDLSWDDVARLTYWENAPVVMALDRNHRALNEVYRTGRSVIDNSVENGISPGKTSSGNLSSVRTFLGLPLIINEKLSGIIGLANRNDGYNKDDIVFLEPVVRATARILEAMRQRRGYDEMQHKGAWLTERLAAALETLNDGFVLFDAKDRLVLCNSRYKKFFGVTANKRDLDGAIADLLRTGAKRDQVVLADGTWLRMEMHETQDGGHAGLFVDITQLKHIQDELKTAKAHAEKASRAKSEFLLSMSHELRTPMNAVLGFSQLLKLDVAAPLLPRQSESVDHIRKAGKHLLGLINEILDLSRIEAGRVRLKLEALDPRGVIEDCLSHIEPLARARAITLDASLPSSQVLSVCADRMRLKQVFLNLLSNAIKYNNDGGRINFTVDEGVEGFVRFGVTDTGAGIPEDLQAFIFDPFFRVDDAATEGSGVGLAITRKLVALMGGTVTFESTPGRGSSFWVELRSAPPAPLAASTDEGADEPCVAALCESDITGSRYRGTYTVLYVEDNADNLKLMEHVISMLEGIELISASSAEMGLELAALRRPEMILMDINLPGMNGIEALQALRKTEHARATPVIAISAEASFAAIEKGLAAGFDAYLTKPIDLNEVITHIHRGVAGRIGPEVSVRPSEDQEIPPPAGFQHIRT